VKALSLNPSTGKKKKMDWRCNSSCRTPVSTRVQTLVPPNQNKTTKKKTKKKKTSK
jgi:hypothetical protein